MPCRRTLHKSPSSSVVAAVAVVAAVVVVDGGDGAAAADHIRSASLSTVSWTVGGSSLARWRNCRPPWKTTTSAVVAGVVEVSGDVVVAAAVDA